MIYVSIILIHYSNLMFPRYSLGILFFFDYTDGIHKHDMYD